MCSQEIHKMILVDHAIVLQYKTTCVHNLKVKEEFISVKCYPIHRMDTQKLNNSDAIPACWGLTTVIIQSSF